MQSKSRQILKVLGHFENVVTVRTVTIGSDVITVRRARPMKYEQLYGWLIVRQVNGRWCTKMHGSIHRVSKELRKIVLSELRQISTNFDNFWQKDGKRG